MRPEGANIEDIDWISGATLKYKLTQILFIPLYFENEKNYKLQEPTTIQSSKFGGFLQLLNPRGPGSSGREFG